MSENEMLHRAEIGVGRCLLGRIRGKLYQKVDLKGTACRRKSDLVDIRKAPINFVEEFQKSARECG